MRKKIKLTAILTGAMLLSAVSAMAAGAEDYDTWYEREAQAISDSIEQIYNDSNGAITREEANDLYQSAMDDLLVEYYKELDKAYNTANRKYGTLVDAYWDGMKARWEKSGTFKEYQVVLYRDGSKVYSKTVKSGLTLSLGSQLDRSGSYYFKVRGKDADGWSSYLKSDTIRVNGSSAGNTTVYASNPGGPGMVNSGSWIQEQGGARRWWYRHSNGSCTKENWEYINGKWYYFDGEGWMKTGWLNYGGRQYYLAGDGAMVTGSYVIDNVSHTFGPDGAMQN